MNKTKIEIIEETVEFYSVPGRRSVNSDGICYYVGDGGKHCAFARCIKNPQSMSEGSTVSGPEDTHENFLKAEFMEGYEGHSEDFWRDIQILHDETSYWKNYPLGGLTRSGIEKVATLKTRYSN